MNDQEKVEINAPIINGHYFVTFYAQSQIDILPIHPVTPCSYLPCRCKVLAIIISIDLSMIQSDRRLKNDPTLDATSFSTKEVILESDSSDALTYYLPCYVRFLLKEIDKVSAADMEAVISGTLLFSFHYGNIDREIIEQFVGEEAKKAILLEFNQGESIQLREDKGISMKEDEKERVINFIVRGRFSTNLSGNVFLTPFETLDMHMAIAVQTVHLRRQNGPKISFKFNCMDSSYVDVLGHGEDLIFGHYRIASYYMDARYTNNRRNPFQPISYFITADSKDQRKSEKQLKPPSEIVGEDVRNFQYAHFRIPIYKFPGISILTIFLPIEILGIIGLFVFFQEPGLSGRLATIAVLILAFVAFLPTINDSIPQTPTIKLVDILIVLHLTVILMLAFQSYFVKDETPEDFNFVWYQSSRFVASMVMNIVSSLTLVLLFVVHKAIWEPRYTREKVETNRKYRKLARKHWGNEECDEEFKRHLETNKFINI